MEYRKNDIVTLEIVDCGTDGEGIGKADGFTVFVKDAVIGDTVKAKIMKAKKNYGYGRLMEILKPSPYRVEPVCPSARQCGGCQLQAVSYEEQKVFKEKKLRGHLERIGGFHDLPMEPLIGMATSKFLFFKHFLFFIRNCLKLTCATLTGRWTHWLYPIW